VSATAASHATLNARITGLEQAVLAIKESNELGQKANREALANIEGHIGKLYDKVGAASKVGPTWGGIGQVAGVLASYSVLIAFVVGIYVQMMIFANENSKFDSRLAEARERGAFEARISIVEAKLAIK
jgi:hypothetical protein